MKTKILIVSIVLVCLGVGGFFVWENFIAPEEGKGSTFYFTLPS